LEDFNSQIIVCLVYTILSGKPLRGSRLTVESDGAAAIKKLHAEKFDLLITDFDMPGANGIEVMERALSLYPKMPIMLVPANLPPPVAEKAKRLAICILEKPFDISKLTAVVSLLLK
jgi:CheY-like chemotaxis protein